MEEKGNEKEREMASSLNLLLPDHIHVDPYDKLLHMELLKAPLFQSSYSSTGPSHSHRCQHKA